MLTAKQCPYTGPYSREGNGKHSGPTALALKRAMKRADLGFEAVKFSEMDYEFNLRLEDALDNMDAGSDGYGEGRWVKVRALKTKDGKAALDAVALKLINDEWQAMQPHVPALGPVYRGGISILQHDLTHSTDGIPLYPAYDDAFVLGRQIIAPENIYVTRASSSVPGDAFYATGDSGIKYWFGHLYYAPSVGRRFKKGEVFGKVGPNHIGSPHCHVGINVEQLWGRGTQLLHHTDYTHGAPLVGAQLKAHELL